MCISHSLRSVTSETRTVPILETEGLIDLTFPISICGVGGGEEEKVNPPHSTSDTPYGVTEVSDCVMHGDNVNNRQKDGTLPILNLLDENGVVAGEDPNSEILSNESFFQTTHDDLVIDNLSHLLSSLWIKNKDRIIIGHLNINHFENKFEPLVTLVLRRRSILRSQAINF